MHDAPTFDSPSSDPRILRSEQAIQQALLALLGAGRSLTDVTVSALAAEAGVTRKTFYTRFGSLEQVASRIAASVFRATAAGIRDELLRFPIRDASLSELVFRAFDQHREVLALLVRRCPPAVFFEPLRDTISDLMDRMIEVNDQPALDESDRDYLVVALASVQYGVLATWARRGFRESPERVAAFADRLLAEGLQRAILRTDRPVQRPDERADARSSPQDRE